MITPGGIHLIFRRKNICLGIGSFLDDMISFRFSAAVAMSAVYDYEPSSRNDPIVSIINNFLQASIPALTPEKAVLLKAFPFCKCLLVHWERFLLESFQKYCIYPTGFLGRGSNVRREKRMHGGTRWSIRRINTSKSAW